jgi:putative ABC transport system permease protein
MGGYPLYFLITIGSVLGAAFLALLPFFLFLFVAELGLNGLANFDPLSRTAKFIGLMFKNLRRNLLRTSLAYLAIFVLVVVVTGIWSILAFLDLVTSEKKRDLKAIVTERWQIPSQMPFAYAQSLSQGSPQKTGDLVVADRDSMTWQFYGGYTEKEKDKQGRDNLVFFFAMEPNKVLTMMDGIEELTKEQTEALGKALEITKTDKRAVVIGADRLAAINKRVGESITINGLNYRGIDLEMNIVGELPKGRWGQIGIMNRDYLNDALDAYPSTHKGEKHPLADKSLNLVWLRVPDAEGFKQIANQITSSSTYTSPAVKCETAAAGIGSWLDAYRDMIWGMRWLLSPAILIVMALVVANAISISVRERRGEMAVLKVLGYQPWQILVLVLGEALVIGAMSGLLSAGMCQLIINGVIGGVPFGIAFFPSFEIASSAWWWGLAIGSITAFVGSVWPAWTAQSVRVADVFSKVG